MTMLIPPHIGAANAGWDVEAELQKELDTVNINSDVSSSSSSPEGEDIFPAEDDSASNPLQKLLEHWRIKERKLQSFEMTLTGTKPWKYDMLDEISDQGQNLWTRASDDPPDIYNEVQDLANPIFQCRNPATNDIHSSQIYNKALGEALTCSSSFSQQCACDFPSASFGRSCPCFDISGQARRTTELERTLQEHDSPQTTLIPNPTSSDFDKADVKNTRAYQDSNDISCTMDYEGALSLLRKKRMLMLEEYGTAEGERFIVKNVMRQIETEESRKKFLLASRRRQELENEIWKQKQDKIAMLDLEQARQIELFEELQRIEERDLQKQKLDIECSARSLMELELRTLEQEIDLDTTSDQESKHEQFVQTAPDDHCIKCCVLIQSCVRGFLCRRNYRDVKHRNAHDLVSLLLPCESENLPKICGQDYPKCEQQKVEGVLDLLQEPTEFVHRKGYQQRGTHEQHEPIITTSQDDIHGKSQAPEEILTTLADLAESGSMRDFKSCLDLATSYGLFAEASEVEAQLIQRKQNVQSWLEQVVHGWDTTKSKIEAKIQEARRLEIFPIFTVAEAIISEREKEIHHKLGESILKASRRHYIYWMRKAKNFGLEGNTETFENSFQRTIKMVRNCLKREAKLGTKEKYVVLFKNALSLGLQSDVNLALKLLLKRMLQVFKRAIFLECTSITDVDSREHDWNRIVMEAAEIGLDSQTLAELRQTISVGRSFESVQRTWVTTFETKDIGGSFTISPGKYTSVGVADDPSDRQLPANSRKFSISPEIFISAIPGSVNKLKNDILWPLPQDWSERDRLQRQWQQHTLQRRSTGNDNSNFSQHGRSSRRKRDFYLTRCARDKICEATTNPTVTTNVKETVDLDLRSVGHLNSDKECRDEGESSENSESEEDLRGLGQTQSSEMPENNRFTSRKCTLARKMLEEKLRRNKVELRWAMKLDLTDEHLKSLGRGQIFRWCPKLRFLTVDMNKLTTLRGVFQGGEDCLEQLSVKDNLLRDLAGLESLHKVRVLHLDGNLLSQLGFPLSNHSVPNEKGELERNANVCVSKKNLYNLPSPLGLSVVECCWPRLKVLTIGRNRLTKISKLGNLCPNLEVLDVGSNQIISLGCTEEHSLAGLCHLRVLDVGQNRLKGKSLWKGLENCPELVSLVASRNKLRELPNHFGSVLLREIWLNGNAIRRLSCKAWLPSLQRLYLQDNMIDKLESLWGCPALEVLDLSFNSISNVSHLRHLSCFPCLRSLQLNDNPVSEQEDHAAYVLQAVPWLAEFDNEAVAKASRDKAVTQIFKRTMDVVGLEFLKEKLSRGEVLLHGFSNPSGGKEKYSLENAELTENNCCQYMPQTEVNNFLNGEGDESSLWKILSEVKSLASSSSILQNLLAVNGDMVKFEGLRNFSESDLEARSNMIAYQQMSRGLKDRLHAATKERCISRLLRDREHSVQCDPDEDQNVKNSCTFLDLSSESHSSGGKAGESNLELCLEEHTNFDSNAYKEVYSENKEYKLQAQSQIRRVTRVQAVLRGYLARIRVRLLREQKIAMCKEQEHVCACKIQTVWRGWKARRVKLLEFLQRAQRRAAVTIQARWRGYSIRRRFRRALDTAKYMDDDDFEYVAIDESEFLAGEIALSAVCQLSQNMFSCIGCSSTSASNVSKAVIIPMDEKTQAFPVVQDEGFSSEYDTYDLQEVNCLISPLAVDSECTKDTVPLTHKAEVAASHEMEVIPRTFPMDGFSQEETEGQEAPKDNICATQHALQEKPAGLGKIEETEEKAEDEETDITDLLERIGIKSKLNMALGEFDASDEEASRIIKGHLGEISQSSEDPKSQIIPDKRDPSSLPAAEVKKRDKVEELAKDWGFKSERTAQALLKARQRAQQQAKDAAHKNFLQDPEKRLKRFRDKNQGQSSAVGVPTRHLEKRASHNYTGPALMTMDEQESFTTPQADLHKRESSVRKQHGSSCPLAVPRLPHHRTEKRSSTEHSKIKKDMTKHHTKSSTRDLSAVHLPTVLLNTALKVAPFTVL